MSKHLITTKEFPTQKCRVNRHYIRVKLIGGWAKIHYPTQVDAIATAIHYRRLGKKVEYLGFLKYDSGKKIFDKSKIRTS